MRHKLAQNLMEEFAVSTGLSGKAPPRRYLWTDAFAVCNFLGFYRETGNDHYLQFALKLVDQVHHILGQHRNDDSRSGWISGLPKEKGERHPTLGGLRIGKKFNERGVDQGPDSQLEWDQDGQYFHYLTKWMHALLCVSRETGENRYLLWAAELAMTAHNTFTYAISSNGPKRMVWKMSIDLSRPLVESMGHHDPLDGLITSLELQTAEGLSARSKSDLAPVIVDMTRMCSQGHWATEDPLGIGGLLTDAALLAQMVVEQGVERRDLLIQLLQETELSLRSFTGSPLLGDPAERRLAFRELGLSIGLHGLDWIESLVSHDREMTALVRSLLVYRSFAEQIEDFWSNSAHRDSSTWVDHREINTVMLATSLAPEGYFKL